MPSNCHRRDDLSLRCRFLMSINSENVLQVIACDFAIPGLPRQLSARIARCVTSSRLLCLLCHQLIDELAQTRDCSSVRELRSYELAPLVSQARTTSEHRAQSIATLLRSLKPPQLHTVLRGQTFASDRRRQHRHPQGPRFEDLDARATTTSDG